MLAAGFGEETVFRGYLFEQLEKLLGSSRTMKWLIIVLTSVLFGLAHYANQGIPGVEQALITGFVFGIIYSFTKKIWIVMIAHAAFDLTALAMIYWNWEASIAHSIFK
jgi:membrane protease YdiL (CAAX protease family)